MLAIAIVIVLVTLAHAGAEFKGGALARWLGASIGFYDDRHPWLPSTLYLLAGVNILIPLTLAIGTGSPFAWSVTAGALAADALGTHLIPSVLSREGRVPATGTAPLQLLAVGAIAWMGPDLSTAGWLAGVALFAPLRIILRPLAWWDARIVEG